MNLFHTTLGMKCQSIARLPPPLLLSDFPDSSPHPFILWGGGGGEEALRVKCFAQEHNIMTWSGLEPVLLVQDSSSVMIRSQHLAP